MFPLQENSITKLEHGQACDFSQDYRLRALFVKVPLVGGRLLDVGSGNGEIANILKGSFAHFTLTDVSQFLCDHLRSKFQGRNDVSVVQIDAQNFSFAETLFDIITMSDCIEHVKDDEIALHNAHKALKPGGVLFVTVPAFPSLYGMRDKHAGHYRRYKRQELREKIEAQGFIVETLCYWNMIGFMPYWMSEKIFQKELVGPARVVRSGFTRMLNRLIYMILLTEAKILFLPFGITLVAVAKKPEHA